MGGDGCYLHRAHRVFRLCPQQDVLAHVSFRSHRMTSEELLRVFVFKLVNTHQGDENF